MDTSKEYIEMLRKLAQQCREYEEESYIQDGWRMQKGDIVLEYLPYREECFLVTRPHVYRRTQDGTQIYDHNYTFKGIHLDINLPDSEVLDKIQVRTVSVNNLIFLPRQDQLQEMVRPQIKENYGEDISYLHRQFTRWCTDEQPGSETYEQLWLAFVMHELYSKEWNSKEWV